MNRSTLARKSLTWYWRTNTAVVAGVAIASAVLIGALLVGESVRGTLRDLVLDRIGRTSWVVASANFFPSSLAQRLEQETVFSESFESAYPLVALEGSASTGNGQRRANGTLIYGVDSGFWKFHGLEQIEGPKDREVWVSQALADALVAKPGDSIVLRVEPPADIPRESLHGRKSQSTRAVRVRIAKIVGREEMGEFSLRPSQGQVLTAFVGQDRLARDLRLEQGQSNAILISGEGQAEQIERAVREVAGPDDLGYRFRPLDPDRGVMVEHRSGLLTGDQAEQLSRAGKAAGYRESRLFTYLANTLRSGVREIPYSLATAVDRETFARLAGDRATGGGLPPIVLNQWAAKDLSARPGDPVEMEYYVWADDGKLETRTARFRLAAITPIAGLAADRDVSPDYPGLTDTDSLADWDPPFPIDLQRVRDQDEEYWDAYRTIPKAWLRIEDAQPLWQSRWGELTAMRFVSPAGVPLEQAAATLEKGITAATDPFQSQFLLAPVRQQGLAASEGAIDFGQYFLYFSFFLIVSALLLTVLFFKLGIEQRLPEIGYLRAAGFSPGLVLGQFLREGALLAAIGSLLGIVLGIAYAALLVYLLRTWWVGATGTTLLELHVSPWIVAGGAIAAMVTALLTIYWTLRRLARPAPRRLLSGMGLAAGLAPRKRRMPLGAIIAAVGALSLAAGGLAGAVPAQAAYFGAGGLLLMAGLAGASWWLKRSGGNAVGGLSTLGMRSARWRPSRSVLSMSLIAAASFLLISLDLFRQTPEETGKKSGTGGYSLVVELQTPIYESPDAYKTGALADRYPDERGTLASTSFVPIRIKPGEDVSCLNLYSPRNPRVAGMGEAFLQEGRFRFAGTVEANPAEQENPWLLLNRNFADGAIPAIADQNSLAYVLHRKVGEDFEVKLTGQDPVRFRFVAALSGSIFQSEILISEANFLKLYPREQGYRMLLADVPEGKREAVATMIEEDLMDSGADAIAADGRLQAYHQVEATYISTFQALGGLGLMLGTIGLGAVLLRNVIERRRELALLRAVGYQSRHLARIILAENLFLLLAGLAIGVVSALVAVIPALASRGTTSGWLSPALLVLLVLIAGVTASLVALRAAIRTPLLESLRSE